MSALGVNSAPHLSSDCADLRAWGAPFRQYLSDHFGVTGITHLMFPPTYHRGVDGHEQCVKRQEDLTLGVLGGVFKFLLCFHEAK